MSRNIITYNLNSEVATMNGVHLDKEQSIEMTKIIEEKDHRIQELENQLTEAENYIENDEVTKREYYQKIDEVIENLEKENAELKDLYNKSIEREIFLTDEERKTYYKNVELKKEITALKAELEKKLKNAIVPKFKVGQEVFYLGTNKVFTGIITKTKITNSKKIQYSIRSNDNQLHTKNETDVFATEQEARDRLEDMKNEANKN